MRLIIQSLVDLHISITVGEGGAGQTITAADGNNGQNSSFDGIEAVGGGGGAAVGNGGKNGGSGGGGDYLYSYGGVGGSGIPGQGYPGGHGDVSPPPMVEVEAVPENLVMMHSIGVILIMGG